jgi:hypothetical protein
MVAPHPKCPEPRHPPNYWSKNPSTLTDQELADQLRRLRRHPHADIIIEEAANRLASAVFGRKWPRTREDGGLGTEGWLGLMIFLGIALGLVYARLTLP